MRLKVCRVPVRAPSTEQVPHKGLSFLPHMAQDKCSSEDRCSGSDVNTTSQLQDTIPLLLSVSSLSLYSPFFKKPSNDDEKM